MSKTSDSTEKVAGRPERRSERRGKPSQFHSGMSGLLKLSSLMLAYHKHYDTDLRGFYVLLLLASRWQSSRKGFGVNELCRHIYTNICRATRVTMRDRLSKFIASGLVEVGGTRKLGNYRPIMLYIPTVRLLDEMDALMAVFAEVTTEDEETADLG